MNQLRRGAAGEELRRPTLAPPVRSSGRAVAWLSGTPQPLGSRPVRKVRDGSAAGAAPELEPSITIAKDKLWQSRHSE